jgi:LytS/YehU family sensor histidine kinase
VIPRFLLKGKYWQTAGWTLVCFVVTAIISATINITIVDPLRISYVGAPYKNSAFRPNSISFHLSLLAGLRGGITIGGIAAAIKLMKYWYIKEQKNIALQKENMESQLQLLKAQVHPHFLFNTLNNIYSYTQNTSPVASKMVSRLSNMLRFILYESNQPVVSLEKELRLIRDYTALEKVRYGNKLELDLQLPAIANGYYIAPLLLLPLIENSFKHGASTMLEQPWISLCIDLYGNQMRMKLLNGKAVASVADFGAAGIGIGNVKKRLELLYPGKHELNITSDEDVFIVNLSVELEVRSGSDIKKPEIAGSHA